MHRTKCILVSGPRYSGKDYLITKIEDWYNRQHLNVIFAHAAMATKKRYCEQNKLDLEKMLHDRDYKERHRQGLTEFYHRMSEIDPVYFDKLNMKEVDFETVDIIIVDIRYEAQIKYYCGLFGRTNTKSIRIDVTDETRCRRGWVYDRKIDEDSTETALNNYAKWDYRLDNNADDDNNINKFFNYFAKN